MLCKEVPDVSWQRWLDLLWHGVDNLLSLIIKQYIIVIEITKGCG